MTWHAAPLPEVVSLRRGHDLPATSRDGGDVPVVGSAGISGWHNEAICGAPGLVVGRSGASIGKATYVTQPYWPLNTGLYATDFHGNDPYWVYLAVSQLDLGQLNSGSAQPSLNRNNLGGVVVTVPPVRAQRAIAEVLGGLDDKIAANDRLTSATDDLCGAMFEVFAWRGETTLARIASVNEASVKPGDGEVRYLDISSVSTGSHSWPDPIPWAEAPGRARRLVRRGDTVWSTVRPNRRSHALVLDEGLIGSTGLAVITPTAAGPAFVYEATNTPLFTAYLEGVAEGSAYPAVRAERFLQAPVPNVGPEDRERFESVAFPARLRAHAAALESRQLASLRDTLLPHLMSGRITVLEAEKAVEEVL